MRAFNIGLLPLNLAKVLLILKWFKLTVYVFTFTMLTSETDQLNQCF